MAVRPSRAATARPAATAGSPKTGERVAAEIAVPSTAAGRARQTAGAEKEQQELDLRLLEEAQQQQLRADLTQREDQPEGNKLQYGRSKTGPAGER